MKLVTKESRPVIRIRISNPGHKAQALTVEEATFEQVKAFVIELLSKQSFPGIQQGASTTITFLIANGSKRGKSSSITFKGMTPLEIKAFIVDALTPKGDFEPGEAGEIFKELTQDLKDLKKKK